MSPRGLGNGNLTKPGKEWLFTYTAVRPDGSTGRKRVQLGSNKAVAERLAAQIISERNLALQGIVTDQRGEADWRPLAERWLEIMAPDWSERYRHGARKSLFRVMEGMKIKTLGEMTLRGAQAWREARLYEVVAKTANDDLKRVRSFYQWCVVSHHIAENPLKDLDMKKERRKKPARALTEAELLQLLPAMDRADDLAAARAASRRTPRRHFPRALSILGLLMMGCRYNEMRSLTWAEVRRDVGVIVFHEGITKNGTERQYPIDDDLDWLLGELSRNAAAVLGRVPQSSDPLFLSPTGCKWTRASAALLRWFDDVLRDAAIAKTNPRGETVHLHALRHTWASRMAMGDVAIQKTAYLGGWRDLATLQRIYTHIQALAARKDVAAVRLPLARLGAQKEDNRQQIATRNSAARRDVGGTDVSFAGLRAYVERLMGLEPTTFSLGSAGPDKEQRKA